MSLFILLSRDQWTKHAIYTHRSNRWPCGKCDITMNCSQDLHRHALLHHQEGVYKCAYPRCVVKGVFRNTIIEHFEQEHKQKLYRAISIKCDVTNCGEMVDKDQFEQHMKKHSKPVKCHASDCNQSFANVYV